jgi:acyl carrier protein
MSAPPSALDALAQALRDREDVVDAVTFRTSDGTRTVAAVVPGPLASLADLRDQLWDTLPAEQLPDVLVAVSELPRDEDGAVATDRIEAEAVDQPGTYTFRPVESATEIAIAEVWREVLGRARIGADDNFLDLGGDSMTAVLLLDRTNERLGTGLTLTDLLAAASLRELAANIDATR